MAGILLRCSLPMLVVVWMMGYSTQTVLFAQSSTYSGAISGTIVGDADELVGDSIVNLVRMVKFVPKAVTGPSFHGYKLADGETRVNVTAKTTAGTFSFPALPPGSYYLCPQVPNTSFLNPCIWGSPAIVSSLGAAEARSIGQIKLVKGALLKVTVSDPNSLISGWQGPLVDPRLMVGIRLNSGAFYPLDYVSSTSSGYNLSIPVPPGTSLGIWAFSRTVSIFDDKGNTLPLLGGSIPITVPTGSSEISVHIAVGLRTQTLKP